MRRGLWIAGIALCTAVTLSLLALPDPSPWTTSSEEARRAFLAGLDAESKLYVADSIEHWERALQLDPDFVVAKLELAVSLRPVDRQRAARLVNEILAADVSRLSEREQMLVARLRAFVEGRENDAAEILDHYLERHPNDAHAVEIKAGALINSGANAAAEIMYHRLLELDPNCALAYNQLGYVAMAAGRFAEAEEHFTAYRFIVPEQANPHDSLGELYLLMGRLEEAETSFERAIEIRSDFQNSYQHLVLTRCLRGDLTAAEAVISEARAAQVLDESSLTELGCTLRGWRWLRAKDWNGALREIEEDPSCIDAPQISGNALTAAHLAACELGQLERARELEMRLEPQTTGAEAPLELLHLRAVRAAFAGELATAAELFMRIDRALDYRAAGTGIFKLYNRMWLAQVARAQGNERVAEALEAELAAMNPSLVSACSIRLQLSSRR